VSDTSIKHAVEVVEVAGKKLVEIVSAVIDHLAAEENIPDKQKQAAKKLAEAALKNKDVRKQLSECANQQSYNYSPLDFFITPAHASGACSISVSAIEAVEITPSAAKILLDVLKQVGKQAIAAIIAKVTATAGKVAVRVAAVAALTAIVLVATTVPTAGPHEEVVPLDDGTKIIVTIDNDTGNHSARYVAADGTQTVIRLRTPLNGAEQGGYIVTGGYNVLANGQQQDLSAKELQQMVSAVTTAGYILYNQSDSGKNEQHGDGGRAISKADKQIQALQEKLAKATGREAKQLKKKIERIQKTAYKKRRGEQHSQKAKK
jgi:hypothetical protein